MIQIHDSKIQKERPSIDLKFNEVNLFLLNKFWNLLLLLLFTIFDYTSSVIHSPMRTFPDLNLGMDAVEIYLCSRGTEVDRHGGVGMTTYSR